MNKKDYEWIREMSGTHGSSYRASTDDNYPCKVGYIYGKPFIIILFINIILYFKWLKRRTIRWFKQNIYRR